MLNLAAFRTGLLSIGLWYGLQSLAIATPAPPVTLVEAVAEHLTGVLDTTEQARQNPEQPAVQMTTCRIEVTRDDNSAAEGATFLYQEQALIESLAQPYRQRVLQIAPLQSTVLSEDISSEESGLVQSVSYRPPEIGALVGLCDRPRAERAIAQSQIGDVTCRVFLAPVPEGFRGVTASEGCPTQFRGAVRITNEILLHDQGMDTWDRGFDAAGEQVWGATTEPYRFRWQRPEAGDQASHIDVGNA